ncbi:hypothetical protein ACGFZP_13215 [Kitasatospora sp. NPDC048239]|uniref:hypothetical protein n=1 Tax=Kitasatospora sp. NPDC048239 TaxID=3364046 RepID=UPI0037169046
MAVTRYTFDSLVPSWLAEDPGYIAALGEHLVARVELQGWKVVAGPAVMPADGCEARIPVGTVLLRAEVCVEEFDIDLADGQAGGPWMVVQSTDAEVHAYPLDDLIVHDLHDACPCGPRQRTEQSADGSQMWVVTHHSLDGRERHEASDSGE